MAPGQTIYRRTKVANGKQLLAPEGDPHSWWARRFGEILALRLDDLGGGDILSEAQVSLSKRASAMEVELERFEAALSTGAEVNMNDYATVVNSLSRVLEKLGLKREKRNTHNPLADHFAKPPVRSA